MGEHERDVRTYDSIVLGREAGREGAGNCNLRASSMRTVRSYQMMQSQVQGGGARRGGRRGEQQSLVSSEP